LFNAVNAAPTRRSAVEHIGIDVHKSESQICRLTAAGEILEARVLTRKDRFSRILGDCPRARILIEASTESEWVARCLEELGHEVIVADPNYAPMYATRSRRIKTDRRDARALMDACAKGTYRPAHRTSDAQRQIRALLAARDQLVRTRARQVHLTRSLVRREGLRVHGCTVRSFAERLAATELPPWLRNVTTPLMTVLEEANRQVDDLDRAILQVVGRDPVVQRLDTAPGVGPVTAVAFVATLDRVERFGRAHEVESYLGLVPCEHSSGERQRRGMLTKTGNPRMRFLLVEAAWGILRSRRSQSEELRRWAERIATRRGRRVAAVALARRLAGILYAMWRDGTEYQPRPQRRHLGNRESVVVAA
jgi:transposase